MARRRAAKVVARDEAMRDVLATPAGRRVIWELLSGLYETATVPGDPILSAYQMGGLDERKKLLHWVQQADAGAYPKMMLDMLREERATARGGADDEGDTDE